MKTLSSKKGQAIIEYIVMLSVAISVVLIINAGFRKIRNYLWHDITCQVTAACPGCPAQQNVKKALDTGACK